VTFSIRAESHWFILSMQFIGKAHPANRKDSGKRYEVKRKRHTLGYFASSKLCGRNV